MEVQVKELLESIQKDGIRAAEKKSDEIIATAKKKADRIIADAKKEVAAAQDRSEAQIKRAEASSKASLEQAARDVLLSLEKKIQSVLKGALLNEVKKSMTGNNLASFIETVVKSEIIEAGDVQLEISENDAKSLLDTLKTSLAKEFKKGLDVSPVDQMHGGFILREKDGKAYYDFSATEIADILAQFVNPYLAKIIKEAAQKGA